MKVTAPHLPGKQRETFVGIPLCGFSEANIIWRQCELLITVDPRDPAPPEMLKNLVDIGINYLSTGAGFLPSVSNEILLFAT